MILEFLRAEQAIEAMRGATEFEDYKKSCLDCLHYLDRGWNKFDEHTNRQVVENHPGSLKIIGEPGGGTIHRDGVRWVFAVLSASSSLFVQPHSAPFSKGRI